jgi:hypothetical protein
MGEIGRMGSAGFLEIARLLAFDIVRQVVFHVTTNRESHETAGITALHAKPMLYPSAGNLCVVRSLIMPSPKNHVAVIDVLVSVTPKAA